MGCKESTDRGEDDERTEDEVNPPNKPRVPLQSWYGYKFNEEATMPFTKLNKEKKGRVVFSRKMIPTTQAALDRLGPGGLDLRESFKLGQDHIYALAYLHESALNIEHCWRLRVAHGATTGMEKFDRPFYDMLLGVKVFINDILVPDTSPHSESMPQCTSTYRAHEATTQWRAVPVVLWPAPDSPYNEGMIYPPLMYSFLSAVSTLDVGLHDLRVEVCYGCKSEGNFCTDFISKGLCKLEMTPQAKTLAENTLSMIEPVAKDPNPQNIRDLVGSGAEVVLCAGCGRAKRYVCNICSATICGSSKCVFAEVEGYPVGCHIHASQEIAQ